MTGFGSKSETQLSRVCSVAWGSTRDTSCKVEGNGSWGEDLRVQEQNEGTGVAGMHSNKVE